MGLPDGIVDSLSRIDGIDVATAVEPKSVDEIREGRVSAENRNQDP